CDMLDRVQTSSETAVQPRFRAQRRPEERVRLLGGAVDLVKAAEVFHFALSRIRAGRRAVIGNHNLHSLHLMRASDKMRRFFALADLVQVDSVPLILWARIFGRRSRLFHRCTYLDWRDEFWAWTVRNDLKVFFVGGRPGVAERAIETIRRDWPQARVGVHHGYFDLSQGAEDGAAVLERIAGFKPDVLLVGLGMPVQEAWVVDHLEALPHCAIFTVGGAFDYEAGVQAPCPRWAGRLGLEWLFRVLTNPRLLPRYALEPWRLVGPALADLATAAKLTPSGRRAR
ncbi:MAG: WecB/TagA/CpsF family glycosyltransferase, partial [Caulobacteraceae bacterium]